MDKIRRKGTPIGQYRSDLDFNIPFLFKELKELFIVEPILKIYILSLLIVINLYILLDFVLSIYLVQKYLDRWYLVIYYSYKIILLELNYNIYNKELLGIVIVLKE